MCKNTYFLFFFILEWVVPALLTQELPLIWLVDNLDILCKFLKNILEQ